MNGATMLRFPPEHIKALARQMNVHPELLEGNQPTVATTPSICN